MISTYASEYALKVRKRYLEKNIFIETFIRDHFTVDYVISVHKERRIKSCQTFIGGHPYFFIEELLVVKGKSVMAEETGWKVEGVLSRIF